MTTTPDPLPCDECGVQPARFTIEGDADDGSEDRHLCADCVAAS